MAKVTFAGKYLAADRVDATYFPKMNNRRDHAGRTWEFTGFDKFAVVRNEEAPSGVANFIKNRVQGEVGSAREAAVIFDHVMVDVGERMF